MPRGSLEHLDRGMPAGGALEQVQDGTRNQPFVRRLLHQEADVRLRWIPLLRGRAVEATAKTPRFATVEPRRIRALAQAGQPVSHLSVGPGDACAVLLHRRRVWWRTETAELSRRTQTRARRIESASRPAAESESRTESDHEKSDRGGVRQLLVHTIGAWCNRASQS